MKDLVRRFTGSLRRLVSPLPAAVRHPHACPAGPTVRCIGGRPLRGEDTALVRPYLVAHERRADRIAFTSRPSHDTGVAA
ncbi:hypothetical protein ACFYPN_05805 [Streptomyces sp. NPDC005576]|uniref:hypothetical protein n=1 Tax=unclassified Streptomyces TaxID=2593676 RepID=UPI0033EC7171